MQETEMASLRVQVGRNKRAVLESQGGGSAAEEEKHSQSLTPRL